MATFLKIIKNPKVQITHILKKTKLKMTEILRNRPVISYHNNIGGWILNYVLDELQLLVSNFFNCFYDKLYFLNKNSAWTSRQK